jgi:histidine triad (HIT) family protein
MKDCLFCAIAAGNKGELIWQNQFAAAFNDISPKAPTHVLIVPKRHIPMLDELGDYELGGRLLAAVQEVARQVGAKGGYRVQINNGRAGGQVVDHLHIHLLSGRQFTD